MATVREGNKPVLQAVAGHVGVNARAWPSGFAAASLEIEHRGLRVRNRSGDFE